MSTFNMIIGVAVLILTIAVGRFIYLIASNVVLGLKKLAKTFYSGCFRFFVNVKNSCSKHLTKLLKRDPRPNKKHRKAIKNHATRIRDSLNIVVLDNTFNHTVTGLSSQLNCKDNDEFIKIIESPTCIRLQTGSTVFCTMR